MIRFWGQPKYAADKGSFIGYELFLRQRAGRDGDWQLPDDFSRFDASTITKLLEATLKTLPSGLKHVSFNLDQSQFVDPAYVELIGVLQREQPLTISIELTERKGTGRDNVTIDELRDAAAALSATGAQVCLDDVGTGANQLQLVRALMPYVSEYKYALQNVRGTVPPAKIREEVRFWSEMAKRHCKAFTLEGLESSSDEVLIHDFKPDIVQGYYYGKPHALPIAEDF